MPEDYKRLNGEGLSQFWDATIDYIDEFIEEHEEAIEETTGTVTAIQLGEGLNNKIITLAGLAELQYATANKHGGVRLEHNPETRVFNIYTTPND